MAIPRQRPPATEKTYRYQVSDGNGGYVDIYEISCPHTLRKHLIAAIDALEEVNDHLKETNTALEEWRKKG